MRRTATLAALAILPVLVACSDSPADPDGLNEGPEVAPGNAPAAPATAALAFVSDRDGSEHIYVANADGSGVTRLTDGSWPAWSHDGRRIAFVRRAGSGHPAGIYVMNRDGSDLEYVGPGLFPTWSPDGSIAFVLSPWLDHPGSGLYVRDAYRWVRELLAHSWLCPSTTDCGRGHQIHLPTWSPDGRTIAFLAYMGADDRGVGIVNADGSDARLLQELLDLQEGEDFFRTSRGVNTRAAWSPDGTTIALITGNPWLLATYPYRIYTYDIVSGDLQLVHSAPGFGVGGAADNPDWSPDGSRIVFDAASREGDPRAHRRIFTVSVATGEVQQLIAEAEDPAVANYRDFGPVWSRVIH